MSKQYYIREGRRFVKVNAPQVVDHRGQYYNEDGSFSEECRKDSIGVCIIQNPKECIICSLKDLNYDNIEEADRARELGMRFGEQEEIHIAIKFYRQQLNLFIGRYYRIKVRDAHNGANDSLFYFNVYADSSYAIGLINSMYSTRLFKTVKL